MVLLITPRERAALQLLAAGAGIPGIADRLGVTEREVEGHLNSLFARMGATGQADAVASAWRRGLLVPETAMTNRRGDAHSSTMGAT